MFESEPIPKGIEPAMGYFIVVGGTLGFLRGWRACNRRPLLECVAAAL